MSYVFVIVTSKTCPHCTSFKSQHMKNLLSNLSNIPNLHVIDISFPERVKSILTSKKTDIISHVGSPTPDTNRINDSKLVVYYLKGENIGINHKIVTSIRGFPQFFLFSKDNWTDQNGNLRGLSFNGTMNPDGTVEPTKVNLPMTADGLSEWVKSNISNYNSTIMTNQVKAQVNQQLPGYLSPSAFKIKIGSFNDE